MSELGGIDPKRDGKPGVILDPASVWCDRHREAFRATWPRGILPATLALFEVAVRDERVIEACRLGTDELASADMLARVIAEFSPLCCLLGDLEARRWTRLALAEDVYAFAVELDAVRSS